MNVFAEIDIDNGDVDVKDSFPSAVSDTEYILKTYSGVSNLAEMRRTLGNIQYSFNVPHDFKEGELVKKIVRIYRFPHKY